jgi:ADP-ribose diphosphatase
VVMVIAINAADSMIMVREYCAGTERYELGFVKGRIDPGETPEQAALRELKEEIGFGARKLTFLRAVDSAPAYTDFVSHLFIATDLYAEELEGDEVEPLQQVEWPITRLERLYQHPEVNDSRVLLALNLVEKRLALKNPGIDQ